MFDRTHTGFVVGYKTILKMFFVKYSGIKYAILIGSKLYQAFLIFGFIGGAKGVFQGIAVFQCKWLTVILSIDIGGWISALTLLLLVQTTFYEASDLMRSLRTAAMKKRSSKLSKTQPKTELTEDAGTAPISKSQQDKFL